MLRFATLLLILAIGIGSTPASVFGQLRVVNWNTEDGPASSNDAAFITVLTAIGAESVNGIAKPIDLLILQEQGVSTANRLASMLNTIYGVNTYRGSVDPITDVSGDIFDDKLGYVWNSATVANLELTAVTTGGPRPAYRGYWQPVGYSSEDAAFYTYSSHLKAGQTAADASTRANESARLRLDGNRLGEGTNIIYAGDYNVYSANDVAYRNMVTNGGAGLAIDPKNGAFNKFTDTQDPGSSMNDRFDFQFITQEMNDAEGVALIDNVLGYRSFGNNGTHSLNGPITTGAGAAPDILSALVSAADHLPVVVDYQLPAVMSVNVTTPAAVVLTQPGAISIPYRVANSAQVVSALSADELDFTVSGTGELTASATGVAHALSGGFAGTAQISTATAGHKSGNLIVASSSEAAQNANFSQPISVTVLDHANPSFSAEADTNSIAIDFGQVALGSTAPSISISLYNLLSDSGLTADLDIDSFTSTGGDLFALSLPLGTSLAAGDELTFQAILDASEIGDFAATYTLHLSDEDLPGELASMLTLTMSAEVVASVSLDGDYNQDGIVDSADYTVWRDALQNGGGLAADGNDDGVIGQGDYDVWVTNYGSSSIDSSSQSTTVPETASSLMAGSLAILSVMARRSMTR